MLLAELHSKLAENSSNEEKMEDVLTSNIFGVLKYLDHPLILKKFLCTAETYDEKILNIEEAQKFEYYFWPKFANGVEPDILVQGFTKDGLFYNILVEVKYYSKKSNIEEEDFYRDQLAEEYKELLNEGWSDDTISTNASKSILLYATANYIKPQLEIEESLSVIEEELGQEKENIELYWVSLRWIYDLIQDYGYYYCEGSRDGNGKWRL